MASPGKRSKKRRGVALAGTAGGPAERAPESRARQPAALRESVEDPLEDWDEDGIGADRWLLEREAEDVERGDG